LLLLIQGILRQVRTKGIERGRFIGHMNNTAAIGSN